MNEIKKLEQEIFDKVRLLDELRKNSKPTLVENYEFYTLFGKTTLKDLFGNKKTLFAIHNMGLGCSYCTTWADGLNGFLPHLESQFAVVLLSKDEPEVQRTFASSRGWRFQMASHGGGKYIIEQSLNKDNNNYPGIVCYQLEGDKIYKKNYSEFGPGDLFCSLWHILSLAGVNEDNFTIKYNYWKN